VRKIIVFDIGDVKIWRTELNIIRCLHLLHKSLISEGPEQMSHSTSSREA